MPETQVYQHQLFDQKDAWRASSDFVNDIIVAQNGMLWIAKENSLVRWDGNKKLRYDQRLYNPFQLQAKKVLKIFELPNQDLVLSTQQEALQVELIKKGNFVSKIISTDESGNKIKGYLADIILSKDKTIYAAFNEGSQLNIYQLKENHFSLSHRFSFGTDIDQRKIKIAHFNNALWATVKGLGVWSCKEDLQKQVMAFDSFPDSKNISPNFILADRQDRLWLGLEGIDENVFLWNGNQFSNFQTPLQHPIDKIKEDNFGQLLFIAGAYPKFIKEVYFFQQSIWQNYSEHLGPKILALYPSKDASKLIFGSTTDNISVIEFRPKKIKNYLKKSDKKRNWGNIIKGINEDSNQDIYFLNEIKKFHKLDRENDSVSEIPVKDKNGKLLDFKCGGAIHKDQSGIFWFKVCDGNAKGILVKYNPISQDFSFFQHSETIRDIAIDSNNKIWIVHHSIKDRKGRLSYFDPTSEKFTLVNLGLSFPEPRYCYAQNDSTIWIGTLKGLIQVNTKQTSALLYTSENSSLDNDRIIVIEQGPDHSLMIGSYGGGFQIFDPKKQNRLSFNQKNGLSNDYVCGIIPIDEDHYWLSTFDGLSYFDYKNKTFDDFGIEDGISHQEFNRFAFHKATDNTIYLGTVNGANAFRTEDMKPQRSDISIGLSGINKYYGKNDTLINLKNNLEQIKKISISDELTYIEFDFYSTDFIEQSRQKILTRLTPYDDEWVYAEDQSVRYRFLPKGEYTLEVKGTHSSEILKIDIISTAPFYKTLAFGIFAAALGIAIIIGFIISQTRIKLKKEQEKQEIARKFAKLELKALQAQLNPHFVFNALGAIQYYIQVNEVEAADNYLTRFARLMRKYLDSSKEKVISLKDEIELLTIYTDLEKLRFEDLFNVSIKVNNDLIIEETFLPSMMIQPFLENAINHGLNERRDGAGILSIYFFKKDEILCCEISDNGIGRTNAQKNKRKGHKSRGMTIINEKVQTLRKSGLMDITIHTEDLNTKDEKFPGTLISLTIKNLEDEDL